MTRDLIPCPHFNDLPDSVVKVGTAEGACPVSRLCVLLTIALTFLITRKSNVETRIIRVRVEELTTYDSFERRLLLKNLVPSDHVGNFPGSLFELGAGIFTLLCRSGFVVSQHRVPVRHNRATIIRESST